MADLSSEELSSLDLSEDATALFMDGLNADEYVKKLASAGLFQDAVIYLGHTLPASECAAWSLSCVRQLAAGPAGREQSALNAVERWLAEPTDEHRRTCKSAAEEAGLTTPAGCLAMAVFFAAGSIAPAERDHVPPPPGVAQKLATGAITLAVVKDPQLAAVRYEKCLQLAPGGRPKK